MHSNGTVDENDINIVAQWAEYHRQYKGSWR